MVLRICPNQQEKQPKAKRLKRKILLSTIAVPATLWLGYRYVRSFEKPQAVLMLGGSTEALEREKFTAEFARQNPNLQIWISSGGRGNYNYYVKRLFAKEGIDSNRLHFDAKAVDTVTNFTTLADELKAQGIHSVYLITSDYHMRRASIIGEIVLGSRGIVFKPVAVPSQTAQKSSEPLQKSLRDGARAILWVFTGRTGSTFSRFFQRR